MLTPTQQQIADGVGQRGWFLVNYVPGAGSEDAEEIFSYTVGLTKTADWPEIIVFGLDADRANQLLGDLISTCWERKEEPKAGLQSMAVIQALPVKLVDFDGAEPRYFEYADWYAEHTAAAKPKRLQMIWPDRNGLLPDNPACAADVRARQHMSADA